MEKILTGCQQRIVLNGQTSSQRYILAGVLQGFTLGLILFLIYVNDLTNGIRSVRKIYTDDPSLLQKLNTKLFLILNSITI